MRGNEGGRSEEGEGKGVRGERTQHTCCEITTQGAGGGGGGNSN